MTDRVASSSTALAVALAFVVPRSAYAQSARTSSSASTSGAEITSDTSAQFYEVRSPTGETAIQRRRLTTTLGTAVYDLLGDGTDPKAPSLSFRARLRYDADYGGTSSETDVTNFGRLVPGFQRGPVDLMYGYLEGRRFLGGWLGFRLGRQYVTDALGWWSFDGGLVKITTPMYVIAEVYGGLEQRGGLPFSLPRYERDGVFRGDRTGYDPTLWSSFQDSAVAPAFGAAVESTALTWIHGRATYRRVYNTGDTTVAGVGGQPAPMTYGGSRISQERVGYAMDATLANVGGVKAGLAYDLYAKRMSNVYASVDGYLTKNLTLSADYDFYVPTFDADSIWNFFMAMPMNDFGLRTNWDATDKLSVSAGGRMRLFQVSTGANDAPNALPNGLAQTDAGSPSTFSPMGGGDLSARYRWGEGLWGARASGDFADTGDRVGTDVYGERVLETRYVLQARAGVWQWNDKLRPDRDATSVQYVLGAGYKFAPRSRGLVEFEHDMNRLVGQRYRVMLWLSLAVTK